MKTVTMTLAEIRRWCRKMAARSMRRDGFSLRESYLEKKLKGLALWSDGTFFDLPEFWRVSMYTYTR